MNELRRALDAGELGNEGIQTALRLGGGSAAEVKRVPVPPAAARRRLAPRGPAAADSSSRNFAHEGCQPSSRRWAAPDVRVMHDSGAAVAEPDDASLSGIGTRGSSSTGASLPLPGLLDTRLVLAELTRLRVPRQGSQTAGLARARIARSQGRSNGGRVR